MTRDDRQRDERFVRDVLARTSGGACERALAALPALTDGELDGLDRTLVRQHLEHCAACRGVAVTLGWLGQELAGLADLDPGAAFTRAVLARTTERAAPARARRHARVARSGPAGLMDRLGRWWGERILAPNFALQAAYVATVLLVLLFAAPGSPLRGTPARMLAAVQAGPTQLPLLGPGLDWAAGRLVAAGEGMGEGVAGRWQDLRTDLAARAERSAPDRRAVADHLAAVLRRAGDQESGAATLELSGALRAGRSAWRAWWHQPADSTGTRQQRSGP